MVALRDVVSPSVLLVAFFTALFSSALDQYPSPFTPEPVELQYALRTVAQQTRFEQSAHRSVFQSSDPLFARAQTVFPDAHLAAPQGLAVSADGRAFVGLADGRIVSFRDTDDRSSAPTLDAFSRTGRELPDCGHADATLETQMRCGRAVALTFTSSKFLRKFVDRIPDAALFANDEVLLVADAFRGVYLFDARGKKTLLFNAVSKTNRLMYVTGLAVTPRGDIYVSDASRSTFTQRDVVSMLLERSLTSGQVVHFSPVTASTRVIASDLAFPNGVVLVDNSSALLIALSAQHKVVKYTFSTKQIEDFAFTPGEPNGLALTTVRGRDVLVAGLFAPTSAFDDVVMRSVKVRKLLSLLPDAVTLQYLRLRSAVVMLDVATGDVVEMHSATLGTAPWPASVHRVGAHLYITSWHNSALVRVPASALEQ